MRFLRRSLVGLFLLSLTIGLFAVAGKLIFAAVEIRQAKETVTRPHRERIFSVNVIIPEHQDIIPQITAFGEIRSMRSLDIRARASGAIIELSDQFIEGGIVQKGALIARIDPQNAQSALARIEADISEAKTDIDEATREITLAKEDVSSALAQAKLRAQALQRQLDLKSRGVGTEAAIEAASLANAAANQAVLSRRKALQQVEARKVTAIARLDRQQINLAEAKRRLADTEIYAPFTGTLSGVSVGQGGTVSINERLALLIDPNALEVSFRLSTRQYSQLLDASGSPINAPLTAVLDVSGVELIANGKITRESGEVGEGLTGRLLFGQLENATGFRAGDFVTVRVAAPKLYGVFVLPAAAVDTAQTVLIVAQDDRIKAVKVEVLRKQGNDVIVRAQNLAGQKIVAERTPLLGEGIKVKPIEKGASPPAKPEMVTLTEERRANLISFVQQNKRMPQDAKDRLLEELEKPQVPARVIERLESRMGG